MRDTIYRDDAIRVASGYCHPANIAKELAKLPSAQPQRMKAHWVDITNAESIDYEYKCSECGFHLFLWSNLTNYCPNCGADMREGQDG